MNIAEHISLDLIPDPLVIIYSNGSVCSANRSFETLIGATRKGLTGKGITIFEIFKSLATKIAGSLASGTEDFDRIVYDNRHFEVLLLPLRTEEGVLLRILFRDITSFIRLEKELQKRNKELIVVNMLSSAFISSENLDLVMEDIIDKVLLITDFHAGWLVMDEDSSFRLKAGRNISSVFQQNIEAGSLDDICNNAFKTAELLYIVKPFIISKTRALREEGVVFLVVLPVTSDKKITGLLFLAKRVAQNFDPDSASLVSLVGNHVSLIIDKIRLYQEAKRLSITDGLTGLYNNRYFYKYLDSEIARSKRYGSTFSLMLFDIDNFKKLNDTHGHQAGDEVLQELAGILETVSRETDVLVRYGGEEFIIILPNTVEEEALSLGNRIRSAVQTTDFRISDSETVSITVSGGIASYPQNATVAKCLLNAADNAMYAAKTAGKNTVNCFKGTLHEKSI